MNDVAGAVDAEELKSAMTKVMMVPRAGEIETVIAAGRSRRRPDC